MDEPRVKDPSEYFAQLVRLYGEKAYNFAYRLAGNEQDARDLVQEAFSHAFKNIDKYDPSRPFGPWFNKILKNIYLDGVRRYAQKHKVSLDGPSPLEDVSWESLLPGTDSTPADELEEKEAHRLVQAALNSLPLPYRTAVILCDIERYSYEQISHVLECPIGTVRSRIHQGRLLMRKAFEKMQYKEKLQV